MKTGELAFKSDTSIFKYLIPLFFFCATLFFYFKGYNYIVTYALCFITIITSFKDTLTILVYEDKFVISYNNILGNFLSIKNTFYYSDIKSYNCSITDWRANFKQSILIVIAELFLAGKQFGGFSKKPEASMEITVKNKSGEVKSYSINLKITDKTQVKALDLIKKIIDKFDK